MITRIKNKILREYQNTKQYLVYKGVLPGNNLHTSFIVISRSRSGSNLLISLLNSHPSIFVRGEEFHNLERRNPKHILDFFFKRTPKDIVASGFKVFYYHPLDGDSDILWSSILKYPNIKFIHLKRKNLIGSIISRHEALNTDVWSSTSSSSVQSSKISIDPKDIEVELAETENYYVQFDNHLLDKAHMEVYYEDFTSDMDKHMKDICAFLGLSDVFQFKTNLKKQSKRGLDERLENIDEIRSYFKGSKWDKQLK